MVALQRGDIDLYPEYTGTALLIAQLKTHAAARTADANYQTRSNAAYATQIRSDVAETTRRLTTRKHSQRRKAIAREISFANPRPIFRSRAATRNYGLGYDSRNSRNARRRATRATRKRSAAFDFKEVRSFSTSASNIKALDVGASRRDRRCLRYGRSDRRRTNSSCSSSMTRHFWPSNTTWHPSRADANARARYPKDRVTRSIRPRAALDRRRHARFQRTASTAPQNEDPSGRRAPTFLHLAQTSRERHDSMNGGAPVLPFSASSSCGIPTAPIAAAVDRRVARRYAAGELVVFLGPSGCGKSTLLRTINRPRSFATSERSRSKSLWQRIVASNATRSVASRHRIRDPSGRIVSALDTIARNIAESCRTLLGWDADAHREAR